MSFGITRTRDARSLLGAAATVAVLTACGGGGGGSTAPKTGSLAVVVTAPTGVTGSVTVTGPNGYTTTVTSSTLLTGLAAGSYTVAGAPVMGSGAIVGTMDTASVSGSPSSVTAGGQDTATVTYAAITGTGGLWVANFGTPTTVLQYTGSQLASSTSAAAATALNAGTQTLGTAINAHGNLWVSTYSTDSILEYSASELAASGTPTPAVVILEPTSSWPAGLAFDANGNLWVANVGTNAVVEFGASQLASSGSPTPVTTITSASSSLVAPAGLAFDANGNLWVSNAASTTVVEYKASQLVTGGALTPSVALTGGTGSIDGPLMIAFDATGNLWVANGNFGGINTVVDFTPSQLAASGTPAPTVLLSANSGSLNRPAGLAFDASGDLWVSNWVGATLVEFTPSQLVTSGDPTPNVTVSGTSLNAPLSLSFDPHATGLPVKPAKRR